MACAGNLYGFLHFSNSMMPKEQAQRATKDGF
jgi:hypothetical protein